MGIKEIVESIAWFASRDNYDDETRAQAKVILDVLLYLEYQQKALAEKWWDNTRKAMREKRNEK